MEKHPRVSDLVAVLNTLIKIVEVRFLRTEITSAVDVGTRFIKGLSSPALSAALSAEGEGRCGARHALSSPHCL